MTTFLAAASILGLVTIGGSGAQAMGNPTIPPCFLEATLAGICNIPPPVAVPEPGSLALLAMGLASFGVFRRHRAV